MSVGFFSDIPAFKPPDWINRLPAFLVRIAYSTISRTRAASNNGRWKMQVETPDFIRIDKARIDDHPTQGCFPTVTAHLVTDRPGVYEGQLKIHLVGRGYQTRTELIPVTATVIEKPPRWTVLVAETPFTRYSTQDGGCYKPLSAAISRLSERGVRVDFRSVLPKSLERWNAILLGDCDGIIG
jgi:hypothetical protein